MSSLVSMRGWVLATVVAVALLLSGCAPSTTTAGPATPSPSVTTSPTPTTGPTQEPAARPPADAPAPRLTFTPRPTATPTPRPTSSASPASTAEPTAVAGPALMRQGASGNEVRDLQARLKQIGWFSGPVTGYYGDLTAEAVRGFQSKRGLPVTGAVDRTTLERLGAMTRTPTAGELSDRPATSSNTSNLDRRCLTGRAMCVSKSTNTLVWVVDGSPRMTMDVRFGSELTPTREGSFTVGWKSRDHVSTLYHTPMPYAMFFSGGQAVHYSPDFAANGYNGSSHGCVNVRDKAAVAALFDQVRVGDKVIVYR